MKKIVVLALTISMLTVSLFPQFTMAKTNVLQFEVVGTIMTKNMRGMIVFVKDPTKEEINSYCLEMKARYQKKKEGILYIHFFDNREDTPHISILYDFEQVSNENIIADYYDNPFNDKNRLTFHKEI